MQKVLPKLRGDEYPAEEQVQAAKRDVLARCIYAVDLNPMAVELCKVSLWINASVRDAPLNFLDHHIKCGNSLIGTTPELMEDGIPTDAFKAVTGDHRSTVNAVRKRNREERKQEEKGGAIQATLWQVTLIETQEDLEQWRRLSVLADKRPKMAREAYGTYLADPDHQRKKLEADFWTAAFFWPLVQPAEGLFPTHGLFRRLQSEDPQVLPPQMVSQIATLTERYRFFHWHLEFPDVFQPGEGSEPSPGSGGFDVVLGNPPWERVKPQEKEFFAGRDATIANARTAAARRKLIKKLPQTDPALAAQYAAALRDSEGASHFMRNSGHYPLTGVGDVNTYAVFTGLARGLIADDGRAGLVIPLGIATDYTYRDFFADVMEKGELVSFFDFENREGIFPGVHRNYNFALATLIGGRGATTGAEFAFFMTELDHLQDDKRRFTLTRADLALINPNTRTCPVFSTRRDADLTRKLYRAAPVLVDETTGENLWGVSFLRMFDMANDSHLFHTREQLKAEGFELVDNRFVCDENVYWPLYEAKMMHQFEHRHGTYAGQHADDVRKGYCPDLLDFIVPRVVELTYTAWDLQPFAQDVLTEVGPETWTRWFQDAPIHTSPAPEWAAGAAHPELVEGPPPFVWDEERRARLRAELDGLSAHLYGLSWEELDYVLDTFPIVRRKDEERYGEYRTKQMVLENYDALEGMA